MTRLFALAVVLTLAATLAAGQPVVITTNTTIDGANAGAFENQDVVVQGCTVTINVPLALNSLVLERNLAGVAGVVTHAPALPGGLQLTIAGDLVVQGASGALPACRVDLTGRGYGPHTGPGAGTLGSSFGGGGGHGGYGGSSANGQAGGGVYGELAAPLDLGSGGAGDNDGYNQLGGAGGGAAHLVVGGALALDGELRADGAVGEASSVESGGGGSGGSIWIEAFSFTGGGTLAAKGGNAGDNRSGGGGGGRIAVYCDDDQFVGTRSAAGGSGYVRGGAGTRFSKRSVQVAGDLVLDNGGLAGAITDLPTPLTPFDGLTVQGAAILELPGATVLSAVDLNVLDTGVLTHRPGETGFTINITNDAYIAAGGRLDCDGRGYGPHSGPGAGALGPSFGGGGGHGGYGGRSHGGQAGGGVYGDLAVPVELGSGGAGDDDGYNQPGGFGGGAIRLNVAGTLTIDGEVSADGMNGVAGSVESSGGGAGGSVWIAAGTLTGAGSLTARGGNAGDDRSGGGGGGRIAIYCDDDQFAGTQSAAGGTGYVAGGAGTQFSKRSTQNAGDLLLDNDGLAGAITDLPTPVPPLDTLTVANAATLELPGQTTVFVANLDVLAGGVVTHRAGEAGFAVEAAADVYIAAGGQVMLDGRGYPARSGPGAGISGSDFGGGGGYGGAGGGSATGQAGGAGYGDFATPVDLGSGGAGDNDGPNHPGGAGGGAIRLTVAGTLTVDGVLSANGLNGTAAGWESSGGGAGGSVWIAAGTLTGAGSLTARGGNAGDDRSGGGGGGRIAVYTCALALSSEIGVLGGTGYQPGGLGTFFHGSPYITISQQPAGGVYFAGDPITLSVTAQTTQGVLTYQWRRNGADIDENPPRVTGTQTATLQIAAAVYEDKGEYDVWLEDDCGAGVSVPVQVVVPPPGDMTCDGTVNFGDINPFVLALSNPAGYAQAWPQCRLLQADCNGDNAVSFADINAFVAILSSGG